jgi:phasin
MVDAPFKIPAEFSVDEARKLAEKSVAQARDAAEKLNGATRDFLGAFEASATIVAKGFSELNAKALEAVQANSASTFDYFNALAGAKSLSDVAALTPAATAKTVEALQAQTKDISSLAQKIAQESAEPLKAAIGKTFPPRA